MPTPSGEVESEIARPDAVTGRGSLVFPSPIVLGTQCQGKLHHSLQEHRRNIPHLEVVAAVIIVLDSEFRQICV